MVTDQAILRRFTFAELMARIAAGSPTPITKEVLFDQWVDTNNKKPGLAMGAHCDDTVDASGNATFNGFRIVCPRAEGTQVSTRAFDTSTPDSYIPIALVNRLDLATPPALGGDDCGEFRIVFAKQSGKTDHLNRNLVVFEGVLPNPRPNGRDLSGCVPVARFWANLSQVADADQRGAQLHDFYYKGLNGFLPVVRAAAYGNSSSKAKGQVRTNQFMQQNWLLRQYRLQVVNGFLRFVPTPSHANPEGLLFNETVPHPKGADFRTHFLGLVRTLAVNDINRFHMSDLSSTFEAFDSDAQHSTKTNYAGQFVNSPTFSASIQQTLTAMNSTLTPAQIVNRAQALSCAGCHQLSNNADLGHGLKYPPSLGFVHVTEDRTEPSPDSSTGEQRYLISPALVNVFLPRRKTVLELFLNGV